MAEETPPMGFIVGMPRAGTTWMSRCLSQHPEIAVFGETAYWGRNYVMPEGDKYNKKEYNKIIKYIPASSIFRTGKKDLYLGKEIKKEIKGLIKSEKRIDPKSLFDRYCSIVSNTTNKKRILEKTPHHVNYIKRIRSYYPDAKFIIMYRRPYEFMLSYKHQGDRKKSNVRKNFKKLYHPIGCSLVYKNYISSINRDEEYNENTIKIKLRDVKNSPKNVIQRVEKFLEVKVTNKGTPKAKNSSFPKSKKSSLDSIDIFWMNTIAGKKIEEAGFEVTKSSVKSLDVIKSIIAIPSWALYSIQKLNERVPHVMSYIKKIMK
jgi:antitoxin (DNA-binding transcriptional repressor) of toxin-antitoxin stability system